MNSCDFYLPEPGLSPPEPTPVQERANRLLYAYEDLARRRSRLEGQLEELEAELMAAGYLPE